MNQRLTDLERGKKAFAPRAAQLKWIQRGDASLCNPYRIIRCVRGFELWTFSPGKSGCLGREFASLEKAKQFAEAHAEKERSTA